VRYAARDAGDVLGLGELEQRPEQLFQMRLQPEIEPPLHFFARGAGEPFIGDDAQARMQRILRRHEFGDRIAGPADGAVRSQHEIVVGRSGQLLGAGVDFAGQRLLRGRLQRLGIGAGFSGIRGEGKAVEAADRVPLDDDLAGLPYFGIQTHVLPQATHQYTGPTVNETLRETFMQRVR
jgi:hypothetical protein